jgi:NAD(P)H-hydrate epimerase
MDFNQIRYPEHKALELSDFKSMDYYAVNNFSIPVELMMENAGLHLANLITGSVKKGQTIRIGIGNGNNGGGGLVAARRLLAWGYTVHLDLITEISKELPRKQLKRALAFGAKTIIPPRCQVWVDAYLGFSQRLPLPEILLERCEEANGSDVLRISLDVPTGFSGDVKEPYFQCDKILTLAAPKKVLYALPENVEIFIADLGIPIVVYEKFNVEPLPFYKSNVLKLTRK